MTEADLRDLVQSFTRHLRAERRAPGTIRLYMHSVEFFSKWLEANELEPTLENLTKRRITDWLADLNTQRRNDARRDTVRHLWFAVEGSGRDPGAVDPA